mmetsp:Transcript_34169/g.61620  ORF Transcript_34169/g.61620 Transcript_34169/m.61620 type:complete len:157 (-) Transcript_34169:369-839(-)|eukprot:CAMPEP_0175067316 /NCGR_PEP_ID=MMETSP0052_2-20121109/17029_1 /TAXON_ID=51329 ORGANISM="Polytomella parva, Strain SAG 63-3" /NCGR_SAMPLE_ID=MMETSP0052_2 /ASSEMBLY_ACC=CAM_ASM_000194 /LENGTH=156 /DNA_ID=CAMNT_0016334181 /DNA_START=43 /DNA_END=513 /DNA_ORIENTATION=-
MSGVERVEYMDNNKTAQITESILKERKIQRDYLFKQEALGKIIPKPPTPPKKGKDLLETYGVPKHIQTIKEDPEQAISLTMSRNMWTSNPGYIVHNGPTMCSTMKRDYAYDTDEILLMKEQGYLDKTFNRKRDEFVNYAEASARMANVLKAAGIPK